ncbi:histidine triad protein [Spiroplasma sabaudiense Ar-1343]|uniref:Histidine triad protein n=1 Tax=Spiroplasma sabaudiense Ar-1343 TaxID=1276257 RepID=W6AA27_9MOLU|nr:HIT domain-containing protein [Spiroplasma sabaudiense]AHI54038.1 histidine triad protein [Spiroplasma sabaudiense Ar-1343]
MEQCLFCQIIVGKIPSRKIYEDKDIFAFLDITPNSDGHSLVIPKKHSVDLQSTDLETLKAVSVGRKIVADILKAKLAKPVKGFNFVSNQGSEAFQMVFHYHEHVIPKYIKEEGFLINKNEQNLSDLDEIHKQLTS